ncbi:hypothetical protein TWF694_010088 [Orbilia ellipsospora]|uniref:C3H1-type domain-containing protein n=1 Tax=Orbilia ellipsospora TaxID=2528407 RepID=A0AAV9XA78_9PEZI
MATNSEETSLPVLPPSSSASSPTNPPDSPLNRLSTNMKSKETRKTPPEYPRKQAGLTPYQYSMATEPILPLQPVNLSKLNAQSTQSHQRPLGQSTMPNVTKVSDLKSLPCPYMKNKGYCRFDEIQCRYTHTITRVIESRVGTTAMSSNRTAFGSSKASPASQATSLRGGTATKSAPKEPAATLKETSKSKEVSEADAPKISVASKTKDAPKVNDTPKADFGGDIKCEGTQVPKPEIQQASESQISQIQKPIPGSSQKFVVNLPSEETTTKGKVAVTLNPPAGQYAAYEPDKLPAHQVYEVTRRKNPFDEGKMLYVDETSGKSLLCTNVAEIRFGKKFGKVYSVHLKALMANCDLAKKVSYIWVSDASGLSDQAIFNLGIKCDPKVIILNRAVKLTDAAFIGLLINCKNLEYLEITGESGALGSLTSTCLRVLIDSPKLAPKLKEVVVRQQDVSDLIALELSQARPDLAITTGTIIVVTKEIRNFLWYAGRLAFVNMFAIG